MGEGRSCGEVVWKGCDRCDRPGGEITYANQVLMPLDGRVRCIDFCIHKLVAALNVGSVSTRTIASCCGHERMPGRISLADGRELMIFPDRETYEVAEVLVQPLWQSGEHQAQPSAGL